MPNNALYFPYIDLPSTSWTVQAILYWDKLASIVPMGHLDDPEQMDQLTRELLSEGLVEPIIPGMYIHQAPRFDECFIEFVERTVLPARRRLKTGREPLPTTRIHAEKMGQIPEFLVESGLAKRVDWTWYEIDTVLANRFMAYLASVLSALPSVSATPITDQTQFATALGSQRPLHAFKARQVVLKSILPIPSGPVDVGRLIGFKVRHGHLLSQLRTKIEAHCARISLLTEPDDRIVATQDFIDECNDQVAEITGAMRPSFAKVTLGSLAPLFGSGLALHTTDQGNVFAYAGAATSLVAAAYQAISSIRTPRVAQGAKPLAYVAHARRELAPNQLFHRTAFGRR